MYKTYLAALALNWALLGLFTTHDDGYVSSICLSIWELMEGYEYG